MKTAEQWEDSLTFHLQKQPPLTTPEKLHNFVLINLRKHTE